MDGYITTMYQPHRQTCPFEWINLSFRWLGYIPHRVRYMSKRVFHQFGYVQTIPSHPHKSANPKVNTTSAISWLCVKSVRFGYACSDWSKDNNWIHKMVFCHFASIHCMSARGCSYPDSSICQKKKVLCSKHIFCLCELTQFYKYNLSWHIWTMSFYTLQWASKHGLLRVWHILGSIWQTLFSANIVQTHIHKLWIDMSNLRTIRII